MKISQLLNKPTPSIASLVKKYNSTKETVQAELQRGIKVEMEHTNDPQVAQEIALDHLGEDLHYYEKLSNMEKNKVQEQELLELFDLNKPPQGVEGPNLQGTIGGKETYYKFAVDDKKYFVTLYKNRFQHVEIVFGDEQGNVGLTNTGNATKVFWSVAQSLIDYLKNNPLVQKIYFTSSSNEPSRIRLYSLLSKRLAQELGWHASSKKPSPPAHPHVVYYVTKDPLRSLDENSLLVELFDLSKPPQGVEGPNLRGSHGRVAYYGFAVDDKKYFVEFHNFPDQDVEIVFGDEHGYVGLTRTGNATKVFWSVAQCLVDYLERHPSVQKIYFTSSSNEPSRLRLYHSLSDRLAQQLGWHASSKRRRKDVEYYVTKDPLRSLDENSLLVELFDLSKVPEGVTPPQMVSDTTDQTIYQFRVGGRKYLCQFTDVDRDTYDLKFKDPEGRMSITGVGEATKVFWSVARAVSMFIQHKSVALLRFSASEPSRQKLYNVLSKRLAETLGWKREIVTHPSDRATYFRLHNPNYQS